jgi:diguanylate cyclase (GGDEF)-like protein
LRFDKEDLVRELTEAHDRLAVLAQTDGLTGMANRRWFDEMLATEISRLQRSGAPLSLILLDVDHFKPFNDTYGHVAGDQCLRQIAQVFRDFLHRKPDFAARYGGEEFVGVLPETDHDGAVALAEKIRSSVLRLAIPHKASATGDCVSVSLGVVTLDCSTLKVPADAVSLADQQLYRAKSGGRNRIATWNRCLADCP